MMKHSFLGSILVCVLVNLSGAWGQEKGGKQGSSIRRAPCASVGCPSIEWVRIPGGSFMMGSESGHSDEKPISIMMSQHGDRLIDWGRGLNLTLRLSLPRSPWGKGGDLFFCESGEGEVGGSVAFWSRRFEEGLQGTEKCSILQLGYFTYLPFTVILSSSCYEASVRLKSSPTKTSRTRPVIHEVVSLSLTCASGRETLGYITYNPVAAIGVFSAVEVTTSIGGARIFLI